MTYKQLINLLKELSDEQLELDVTIYDCEADEFYPASSLKITRGFETDVLDDNHPIIQIN